MVPFAIQLYSVRDHLSVDTRSTLERLKMAGYDQVELFDVAVADAAELREHLDAVGLRAVAAHFSYEQAVDAVDGTVAAARVLGIRTLVIPWLKLATEEQWTAAARSMDAAGQRYRDAGLRLGYHNHEHEWRPTGDTTPFDIIFDSAQPENLFLELDIFWATDAGQDVVSLIDTFAGRCRLLHMKDRAASGGDCRFAEVGAGTIDWSPIFAAGARNGVECYIVEQDESAGDSLESAAISARFMAAH